MEQIGNRISFVKGYTKTEKIAINTKIDRILKELSDMQLGPCSFKLIKKVTCVYYKEGIIHSYNIIENMPTQEESFNFCWGTFYR